VPTLVQCLYLCTMSALVLEEERRYCGALVLFLICGTEYYNILLGVESVGRGIYRLAPILLGLGDSINLVALIFVRIFKVLRSKDLD
jgi:hypothetical protein